MLKSPNNQLSWYCGIILAYRHKRLVLELKINKKKILCVMKLLGIKPYRKVTPKVYQKPKDSVFSNYLMSELPLEPGNIYVSNFTYLKCRDRWVDVATISDL